jgi:hypothetical protein
VIEKYDVQVRQVDPGAQLDEGLGGWHLSDRSWLPYRRAHTWLEPHWRLQDEQSSQEREAAS